MSEIMGGVTATPTAIDTIKENITDQTYNSASKNAQSGVAVAEAISKTSNSLKGTKSGEILIIDDISPLNHNLNVKASGGATLHKIGKNLIPYPYNETTLERNGLTFTDNGDGTITVNGTATANTSFRCAMWAEVNLPKGTYIFSCLDIANANCRMNIAAKSSSGTTLFDFTTSAPNKISVQENIYTLYAVITISSGATVDNLVFKPQIEFGEAATEYEPFAEHTTHSVNADGTVEGVTSVYPTTVLFTDTADVVIDVEYNKDINKTLGDLETLLGGI